jgi:hypothetical protein
MERRALVPFEIAAVVALAIAWPRLTWSDVIPFSLPLLVLASASRWLRGRSWTEVASSGYGAIGAAVGAVALGLALVIGTPLVELVANRAVDWAQFGMVRGSPTQLIVFCVFVAMASLAAELALRGWIVERVLELTKAPVIAVLVGALAEALLVPGGVGVRLGAAIFGIGLGWIYVAGGRSVVAPICARVVFSVGALLLEGFKVIG